MNIALILILIVLLAGRKTTSVSLGTKPALMTWAGTSKYYGTDYDWNVSVAWPGYSYIGLDSSFNSKTPEQIQLEFQKYYKNLQVFEVSKSKWADMDWRNDNFIPGKWAMKWDSPYISWTKSQDFDYANSPSTMAKIASDTYEDAYELAEENSFNFQYLDNKLYFREAVPFDGAYPETIYLKSFDDMRRKDISLKQFTELIKQIVMEALKAWIAGG